MFERLVDFVNARLAEIKALQTEVTDVKADVDQIKNDTPKTSKYWNFLQNTGQKSPSPSSPSLVLLPASRNRLKTTRSWTSSAAS